MVDFCIGINCNSYIVRCVCAFRMNCSRKNIPNAFSLLHFCKRKMLFNVFVLFSHFTTFPSECVIRTYKR